MLESLSKTFKDARLKLQGKKEISEEDKERMKEIIDKMIKEKNLKKD